MLDYMSKCYQNFKLVVASSSAVLSLVTTIVGMNIGVLPLAITGGLSTFTSGFVVFDTVAAWSAIKGDVDRLVMANEIYNNENNNLQKNIDTLRQTNIKTNIENNRLNELSKKSKEQLDRLLHNNKTYLELLKEHEIIIVSEQKENDELSNLLRSLKKHVDTVEHVRDEYLTENKRLSDLNEKNEELIIQFKKQISEMDNLISDTKDTVIDINESATNTNRELEDTHDNYEDTLTKLIKIVNTIKMQTFDEMDKNQDGNISREEFNDFVIE